MELLWGRDQLIAEMQASVACAQKTCQASMGPRSADRGNFTNGARGPDAKSASMGPRSADRGNVGPDRFPTKPDAGFNGAAIS